MSDSTANCYQWPLFQTLVFKDNHKTGTNKSKRKILKHFFFEHTHSFPAKNISEVRMRDVTARRNFWLLRTLYALAHQQTTVSPGASGRIKARDAIRKWWPWKVRILCIQPFTTNFYWPLNCLLIHLAALRERCGAGHAFLVFLIAESHQKMH